MVFYVCVKAIQSLYWRATGHLMWQLKLMIAHGLSPCDNASVPSITADMALSISQQVFTILENWENGNCYSSDYRYLPKCYRLATRVHRHYRGS